MKFSFLLFTILLHAAVSQLIRASMSCISPVECDYEGARCVDSDGNWVKNTCTKYYALCTERKIQTAPIEMNDPTLTSCLNDVIVAASTCTLPVATCTKNEIECTDAQGAAVTGTCTSYYRECDAGNFGEVMPVAAGTKCLNGDFVLNTDYSSADCTFTNIQCTNGAGTFVNTYCTGYFVECNDGTVTDPVAVPEGTQCYQNEFVIKGTCADPVCSFTDIKCSDAAGTVVSNACTGYFVECNNGTYTVPQPVADGTQCYNDNIVLSSTCEGATCTGDGIVCSDANGAIMTDTCTGYFRQCDNGSYHAAEEVPAGTRCKNGEFILTSACSSSCTTGTRRCTDNSGSPVTNSCTLYYQTCTSGQYGADVENVNPGESCYNGNLIPSTQCTSTEYECDFTGIRCSTSDGTITTDSCTDYYIQCEFGMYTKPRKTADGTKCYNNEQVTSSACSASCDFTGIQCSDYSGSVVTGSCTNYYVECDNGLVTKPLPTADGTKCLNGEQVHSNSCSTPVCDSTELICSNEQGVIDTTGCTDYYMECFNGLYITPRKVASGTKCRQGQIVLASNCTGTECSFEGIKCCDADGTINENECKPYFVQCADGELATPQPVGNGTRCYNGFIVNTASCDYQNCDFIGLKCSDANGVVYYSQCTSYFLECGTDGLSRPMPVAEGTRCLNGAIVGASRCSSSECDYEGLKCTDANGVVYTDTCTNYYVECDNGAATSPRPVAEGTKCYNGEQVASTQCSSAECSFTGIRCSDANGVIYPDTCTSYFVSCDNGKYTAPMSATPGTRCYNETLVLASQCSGVDCDYEGIKCADAYGNVYTDTCTEYYVQCADGVVTAPRAVANGTRCYNGEQVNASTCSSSTCDYEGIVCTDAAGVTNTDSCTSYYVECDNGIQTAPRPVADGTRCLKGSLVETARCHESQCTESTIVCSDANGAHQTDACTNYYVECNDGSYTSPRPVADGTRCYNGEQVLASQCPGVECTTTDIRCSDANGVVTDTECTSYYLECDDGSYTSPMPVAKGTQCLAGELVLPYACSSSDCDFTGIKCSDASGIVFDTTCTDHYVECDNGKYTSPMVVPKGTNCLAGELVLSSVCPGTTCSYDGIKCSDSTGSIVSGSCTSYYVECVDGAQSKALPVASGTRCLNNELVLSSTCSTPQCSFAGVQCVDASGAVQTDSCTSYYRECVNNVIVGPIAVEANQNCYNNEIVASTQCPSTECDFTGFICSDSEGALLTNTCSDYYVRCVNGKYSSPIAVASGSQCYNQQLVEDTAEVCTRTTKCSFDGIKCATSDGAIVADHCTSYYVMCNSGELTEPRVTAPGTKCYKDEQVLSSACSSVDCSFTGKICVNSCGDFVTNQCTAQYAECVDGKEAIKTVTSGEACYNSQIVADSDAKCTVTVEVTESKTKGIRGRK